ncbi:MAG: hypothetical protein ACOYIS_05165 [Candidatus Cloacimonadaceae bacterium]|jgi:hypothetical protein
MKKHKSLKFKESVGTDLGRDITVLDMTLMAKVRPRRYERSMYRTPVVKE